MRAFSMKARRSNRKRARLQLSSVPHDLSYAASLHCSLLALQSHFRLSERRSPRKTCARHGFAMGSGAIEAMGSGAIEAMGSGAIEHNAFLVGRARNALSRQ
jgi:hypothetical protein